MTAQAVGVSLELGHEFDGCRDFAGPLFLQLSGGAYDRCSVMDIPASVHQWRSEHRTARKRADHSANLAYTVKEIHRENYTDDIFAINTSLDERQGRRMTQGYRVPQTQTPLPDYECGRHAIRTYGVSDYVGTLVAYLWLYRAGDLALVSSILGHGDHLGNDVMYLLFQQVVGREREFGEGFFVYNRHDSGTDGLRYFKERLGFQEAAVEWLP